MNKRGIASTADAIVFLATMLLAISAMYSLSITTNAGYNEDDGAIMQARWTAQALCGATYSNGFSFQVQLVNEGYIDNLEWVNCTMDTLTPVGWNWNVIWSNSSIVQEIGSEPLGDVSSWSIYLKSGVLEVRIFRT